jgi:hypothetical protein
MGKIPVPPSSFGSQCLFEINPLRTIWFEFSAHHTTSSQVTSTYAGGSFSYSENTPRHHPPPALDICRSQHCNYCHCWARALFRVSMPW